MTVREPRPLPSVVVPGLPPAVMPPPKTIQAPTTEAVSLKPTDLRGNGSRWTENKEPNVGNADIRR
jgi:hypothetical protein